jgi:beta-alanine degradation protein BauB
MNKPLVLAALPAASLVCLAFHGLVTATPAVAQDVVEAAPQSNKVLVDNATVRVVEGTIAPGAREAMHTHAAGWYYVTQAGTLQVDFADGTHATWSPKAGESGWMEAEGPHVAENVGKTTLVWTLVEAKTAEARRKSVHASAPKSLPF